MDESSKLLADAAAKLSDILAAVTENSALMQGISEANREQTTAIGEVRVAIQKMDEMTQHNVALVEETNAAIEQTEAQASQLDGIVEIFKIEAKTATSEANAPRPRKPIRSTRSVHEMRADAALAVKAYLSHGNTALKDEWSEF